MKAVMLTHRPKPVAGPPRRRGSTLVIVISLLSLLMFLGFVFYTFAAQERVNAEFYAEAHKDVVEEQDDYFDYALEQLIVGPPDQNTQSALWGRRHAMLSNLIGDDLHVGSAAGFRVAFSGSGDPAVVPEDSNLDGTIDNTDRANMSGLIEFNDSPAVRGFVRDLADRSQFPDWDVDYTSPDHNTLFVSFNGKVVNSSGGRSRVIIPSFHRPQLLRSGGAPILDWYESNLTSGRVFRPHPNHIVVDHFGNPVLDSANNPIKRFIATAAEAAALGVDSGAFPFKPTNQIAAINGGNDALLGEMGVFTNSNADIWELDVDNDGDDVREGIWMDLGFPLMESTGSDIKLYVPLFSYTVVDLGGLFNLNAHGNLNGLNVDFNEGGSPFGMRAIGGRWYESSRSNQGLGPHEINPLWGLNDFPVAAQVPTEFEQHQFFFNSLPADYREARNMEWWFLLSGRAELSSAMGGGSITDIFAGRYGELDRLGAAVNAASRRVSDYPKPGRTDDSANGINGDDNGNRYEGEYGDRRAFGHPVDFTGRGSFVGWSNANSPLLQGNGPIAWQSYEDYHTSRNRVKWTQVTNGMRQAAYTNPANTYALHSLIDDPLEVVLDPKHAQRPFDNLFTEEDQATLSIVDANPEEQPNDRLRELALFNFQNPDVRKRFGVTSWNRNQFVLAHRMGKNGREIQEWNSRRGTFPPEYANADAFDALDPFRPQVRRMLEMREGNQEYLPLQMPISVNELVDVERRGSANADELNGLLIFRPLTEHPDTLSTSVVAMPTGNVAFPPRDTQGREYWARRDRQQLARDIYVLLYTFCGPENKNPLTDPGAYSVAQKREMARFAVNLIDMIDRDDVISKFEYDTDLTNGWNLNDNVDDNIGDTDRAVVNGVERQQLTLSEALVIRATPLNNDHAMTIYNDTGVPEDPRYWIYTELRNTTGFPQPLAHNTTTSGDEAIWRIKRTAGGDEEKLSFLKDAVGTAAAGATAPAIPAGGLFLIGSQDGSDNNAADGELRPSIMMADTVAEPAGDDRAFEILAPNQGTTTTITADLEGEDYPNALLDLDLARPDLSRFDGAQTHESSAVGAFAELPYTAIDVKFELQRRRNPLLPKLGDDSDWITVDEMTVPVQEFKLEDTSSRNDVKIAANGLSSGEREVPLERITRAHNPGSDGTRNRANTLGSNNSRQAALLAMGGAAQAGFPQAYGHTQFHLDRDLVSIGELLQVPLYGPDQLTDRYVAAHKTPPESQSTAYIAAARFLHRDTAGGVQFNWQRLLEFVNVPTRVHRQLASPLDLRRVPGKLNLNMIRHPEVLGGLIDDPRIATENFGVPAAYGELLGLNDPTDPARDWWEDFVKSRDAILSSNGVDYYIPGMPGSKPFRAASRVGVSNTSIQDTVLRSLNDTNVNGRRLFELAATPTDRNDGTLNMPPSARYRLLSKIMGNTTTRSNTFAVFVTVGFFEAHEDASGAVRIGGRLDLDEDGDAENDQQRGFFVVDRSDFEEAYDRGTGSFANWRKLVKHELIIE